MMKLCAFDSFVKKGASSINVFSL